MIDIADVIFLCPGWYGVLDLAADAWPGLTASLSHLARANISVTAGLSAPRLTKKGWRELFLLFILFLFCFILLYDTLD